MAQTKIAGLFLDPTVLSDLGVLGTAVSNADYLFVWDATDSLLKKILPDNLGLGSVAHTIQSHDATSATGANLETLTNAGDADALHTHALKASLAAPALTGHATATTQAGTDDSTRIATTAHVKDVKIDDFAAGDDNADLDSSTSRHGLLLKLGGGTTNFLRADGAWASAGAAQTPWTANIDAGNFELNNVSNAGSDWTNGVLTIARGTSGAVRSNLDSYSAGTDGGAIQFRHSRHTTIGSHTALNANDDLGKIRFYGSGGSAFSIGAIIQAKATETFSNGSSNFGTKLEFYTTDNTTDVNDLRMTIGQDGSVGIGTDSPTEELHVAGTSTYSSANFLKVGMTGGTGAGVDIAFQGLDASTVFQLNGGHSGNTTRYLMKCYSAGLLQLALRADGYMSVGGHAAQAPRQPLDILGAMIWGNNVGTLTQDGTNTYIRTNVNSGEHRFSSSNSNSIVMTIAANGVISGDFNDTSDERLKENIVDTDSGLDKILQLRPVSYNFKPGWGSGNSGRKRYGLIAQEVEAVFPEAVNTSPCLVENVPENMRTEDMLDNPKSINLGQIISTLIKSVQELKAEIDVLKA